MSSQTGGFCFSMRHNYMNTDWFCLTTFLMPRVRWVLQVKNTSGISPMWIIHHIFKESQSLISWHTLCISNPGEACYTYNPMFSYFKSERKFYPVKWAMRNSSPQNSHNSMLQIRGHWLHTPMQGFCKRMTHIEQCKGNNEGSGNHALWVSIKGSRKNKHYL